jgi:DNA-directed RNA polymerase specialized sigma24 family protein
MPYRERLRLFVSVRASAEADRFWRARLADVHRLVVARQRARGVHDPERAEELAAEVLAEFITRAWRVFEGDSDDALRGFLRGIAANKEAQRLQRARLRADLAHRSRQDLSDVRPNAAPAQLREEHPVGASPPLPPDDVAFLTALREHGLSQRALARESGSSEAHVSRRYARIRARARALSPDERDRLESWLT